jgi:signal peptidase
MKPEFQAGDVVVTKMIDVDQLVVGDIITFLEPRGSVVTHKIHAIEEIETVKFFTTKGMNDVIDENTIIETRVIGKYAFAIPYVGNLVMFIKTPVGFLTFIFFPLLVLFILYLIDFIKAIKYKNRSKKEKIEEEKLKNANIQLEINTLKSKLNFSGDKGKV